jgi:hypothetical protein
MLISSVLNTDQISCPWCELNRYTSVCCSRGIVGSSYGLFAMEAVLQWSKGQFKVKWSLIFILRYIIHGDTDTSARQSLRNGELREGEIDLHRKYGHRWYSSVQTCLQEQMSDQQYCHRLVAIKYEDCNKTSPACKNYIYIMSIR